MTSLAPEQKKFTDQQTTAQGEKRAYVDLNKLQTLWFNTGTLCNLACVNCYIESTPKNDRLLYLNVSDVVLYLDEIEREKFPTFEIGLTGGEPFMNPDIINIMDEILRRGFKLLVLTNAMRPMMKWQNQILRLRDQYKDSLTLRVSIDHHRQDLHEEERGEKSWNPMLLGLKWLCENNFSIDIASRTRWGDTEFDLRKGFEEFFNLHRIPVDAYDRKQLMLFPEMDEKMPVPEITTTCWQILNVNPDDMMCASSRMVVKHKGDDTPSVMACTLLAYDENFNLGKTLKEATKSVYLNHPHCAKFCVLGGGSCSAHP